jgi:hypothetical protein
VETGEKSVQRFSGQVVECILIFSKSRPEIFPAMNRFTFALCSIALLSTSAVQAVEQADTQPPTITLTNPALGAIQTQDRITVSGTAVDTVQAATGTGNTVPAASIKKVEYRLSGSKKWHSAILIPGTAAGNITWAFTIKLGKGKSTYVSVRSSDNAGNESDIITRFVKRSRTTR